jgi:hypothetical protein
VIFYHLQEVYSWAQKIYRRTGFPVKVPPPPKHSSRYSSYFLNFAQIILKGYSLLRLKGCSDDSNTQLELFLQCHLRIQSLKNSCPSLNVKRWEVSAFRSFQTATTPALELCEGIRHVTPKCPLAVTVPKYVQPNVADFFT